MRKKITHKIYQYTAVFEPDEKVGGFTATIPALPGCISEGDTFEEALKNIKEAATLYLEDVKEGEKKIYGERQSIIVAPIEVSV
jgi:antitoxin HicB